MIRNMTACLWLLLILSGCRNENKSVHHLPLSSGIDTLTAEVATGYYNAVIEIPAGTNRKIEYDKGAGQFKVDQKDNRDRVIAFLPYPANYGYIPGTLSDASRGGDGDPVDILVLCESLPTGTVIKVRPLAMLKLIDDGEEDYKILAVPEDDDLNVLKTDRLEMLPDSGQAVKQIIETWFQNYDSDPATVQGWGNAVETMDYIRMNIK